MGKLIFMSLSFLLFLLVIIIIVHLKVILRQWLANSLVKRLKYQQSNDWNFFWEPNFLNLNYIDRYIVINLIRVFLSWPLLKTKEAKDPRVALELQFANHLSDMRKSLTPLSLRKTVKWTNINYFVCLRVVFRSDSI